MLGAVFFVLLALSLFALLFLTPKLMGFVATGVTINSPPTFNHSTPIPNQSFDAGSTISNAFDLDDYFSDAESSTLSYKSFGNSSITTTISPSGGNIHHLVSFSSSNTGSEIILFYAYDGQNANASSNNVTVTVNGTNVTTTTESGGGGGGGGGGTRRITKDPFSLVPDVLKLGLKQGESITESFTIKNNLDEAITVTIDFREVAELLSPSSKFPSGAETKENIIIGGKKEKQISLEFFARENLPPDVYIRSISLKSGTTTKSLPVILSINSRDILFSIFLTIQDKYRKLHSGEMLVAEINLARVSGTGNTGVDLETEIRDILGNIVLRDAGSVSVNNTIYIKKLFVLPQDIAPGKYVLVAKISYAGGISVDADTFEIAPSAPGLPWPILLLILASVFSLFLAGRLIFIIIAARKVKDVSQMIAEAYALLRSEKVVEALALYRELRERFDSLPSYAKKKIWNDSKLLNERLRQAYRKIHPEEEVMERR